MKIKLIAPARKPEWGESFWDLKTLCKLTGEKAGGSLLALPTLAALTPSDIEVVLTDENVEPIDFNEKVDLVGITGMTCLIPRSYEIADKFKKRGVTVVMGGIHVSMLPEEAIAHCDSVVIGEAEDIWEQIIRDVQNGKLQKFYKAEGFPDLTSTPIPRWDLLKNDRYCFFTIQTSRGCPYDCEFCTVKVFNGRKYRHKPIEKVIEEVKVVQRIDTKKLMFFTDDNLLAMPGYAEELIRKLIPLKIKSWWCQSSVNRLKDENILKLMYEAGCRVVFIGFESVSQKSLDRMNKSHVNKVEEYKEVVDKIHSNKISVIGSFIFGGDADDENIFEDTIKFIDDTNIAFSMVNIITPLPGTVLYQKLEKEGRVLHRNWEKYNMENVNFSSMLDRDVLQNGHRKVIRNIYSYEHFYKRLNNLWRKGVFIRDNNSLFEHFTKGRFFFSTKSILEFEKERRDFVLKCLWNRNVTSLTSIMLALSYHDFMENLK